MLRIKADVAFTAADGRQNPVTGRIEANGSVLYVHFSQLPCLIVGSSWRRGRQLAERLADLGLTVRLVGPDESVVLEVGHGVHGSRLLGLLLRTRSIRVHSLRAVLGSRRGPRLLDVALPRLG